MAVHTLPLSTTTLRDVKRLFPHAAIIRQHITKNSWFIFDRLSDAEGHFSTKDRRGIDLNGVAHPSPKRAFYDSDR